MTTDYKPGVWYGWNGGECPVHPMTVVEVVKCEGRDAVADEPATADGYIWEEGHTIYPIIAFRVVKEYREPLECWIPIFGNRMGGNYDTEADARAFTEQSAPDRIALFREVRGGDAQ